MNRLLVIYLIGPLGLFTCLIDLLIYTAQTLFRGDLRFLVILLFGAGFLGNIRSFVSGPSHLKTDYMVVGSAALYFDMDRARKDEKRSSLSKAFSALFRRRKVKAETAPPTSEWSEIDLVGKDGETTRTTGPEAIKQQSSMKEFKQTCKRVFGEVFGTTTKGSKPKPLQQTIPVQFKTGRGLSEDISMSPIKSQADIHPKLPTKKISQLPAAVGVAAGNFQKLAIEQWRRDQERMFGGTFAFPSGFLAKYHLLQVIGEGSFGFVMVARRHKDGKEVAVKWGLREKIPPNQWLYNTELGLVPSEVHILHGLSHQNIVQLLDYFDGGGDYVCMVTELHGTEWTWPNAKLSERNNPGLRPASQLEAMRGAVPANRRSPCDLFECIEAHAHLPESTVFLIFSQILDAVLYLRHRGLVHRDLKDENIVINEAYRVKLVDFGSCSEIPISGDGREAMFKQFNGTIAFAAPEIIRGNWYYPTLAEVWTLGILLFTMTYKRTPFQSTDEILHATPKELLQPDTELNGLLRAMLEKQAGQRIPLDMISEHPWFRKCQTSYTLK